MPSFAQRKKTYVLILLLLILFSELLRAFWLPVWQASIAVPFRYLYESILRYKLSAANDTNKRKMIVVDVLAMKSYFAPQSLEVTLCGDGITNIEALSGLTFRELTINCIREAPLDLSPLDNTKISELSLESAYCRNYEALANTGVSVLCFRHCEGLENIAFMRNMKISQLDISDTNTQDIRPLYDMPLTEIDISKTKVTDISVLSNSPLETVRMSDTDVSDLSPLRNCPLQRLEIANTKITTLLPIQDTKLQGRKLRWHKYICL